MYPNVRVLLGQCLFLNAGLSHRTSSQQKRRKFASTVDTFSNRYWLHRAWWGQRIGTCRLRGRSENLRFWENAHRGLQAQ